MLKTRRLLLKIFLTIIFFILSILLMTLVGFKMLFALIFIAIAGNIWKYNPVVPIDDEIIDYYETFKIHKETNSDEIEMKYKMEVSRINNDVNIPIIAKRQIIDNLEEGFNILRNPGLKEKYDKNLQNHYDEIHEFKKRFTVKFEILNMLSVGKIVGNIIISYLLLSIILLIVFSLIK